MRRFLLMFMMGFSVFASAATLNKVIVFGDSLSDNGNLYEYMKHQLPMSPPYYKGRMTNGPVWIELLTQSYYADDFNMHLVDYAYAGASVEEGNDDEPLFTLGSEIDSYLLAHQNTADEDALYVLWISANNYLALPEDAEQALINVDRGIKRGLQRLADNGAKHFLILNLPDLGQTPVAREMDATNKLTNFTNRHNEQLLKTVESLKTSYPAVQWLHFDVRGALDEMLTQPARNGFNNVKDSCLDSLNVKPSVKVALNIASTVKVRGANVTCEGYLFFDFVHPSSIAHQILANRIRELLDRSNVEFVS